MERKKTAKNSEKKIFSGKLHPSFWVVGVSLLTTGVHLALDQVGSHSAIIPLCVGGVLGCFLYAYSYRHRKQVQGLHHAGAEVRRSEEKYRAFFENSADAMLIIDGGTFVDCNDAAAAVLGYDRKGDVIQTSPSALSPEIQPDGRASSEKAEEMMRLAREKGHHRFDWEHLRKDGETFSVEVSLTLIPGDGGTQLHVVWRELTERKQAESALRENELLLRTVIEAIPDMVWLKDREGVYLFCNSKFGRFFGASVSEIIGKTDHNFIEKEQADFFREKDRLVMDAGVSNINEEEVIYAADGHKETLETMKAPVFASDGALMGVLGIGHDITDRKKAETALLASTQKLALHMKQTPLGVVGWDLDFKVTEWNPAAERIFGYTEAEALGRAVSFILPEGAREQIDFVREQLFKKGKAVRSNNENLTQDGRVISCEWYNTPLVDSQNEVVGVASLVMDVTERTEAEKTRKGLEEQLRHVQKMKAVGQMAGGLAHEFNNLLQVIGGYAELSQVGMESDNPIGASLQQIEEAAQRGKILVAQILAFGRRQIIDPVDLDLNDVFELFLNMLRKLMGEHIKLEMIAGSSLGTVHFDRGLLEQVVVNLCVNARDAMPDGGTLTIETQNILIDAESAQAHAWPVDGRCVLLSISDTGCGMTPQIRDRVFEPFFTTKEVGQGTGLGLSMAHGIIEQHNGHISVYSEVNQGSIFKIYLPVIERRAGAVSKKVSGQVFGGKETILIAEDDAGVLELAELALRAAGYTVLTARDGHEAIQVFEEHTEDIDLLMFDVVMPRMGGKEAAEQILKIRPELPHLFSSGYSEHAVHTNFVKDGDLHLLSKPYQTTMLLRKIREVLES